MNEKVEQVVALKRISNYIVTGLWSAIDRKYKSNCHSFPLS